MCAAPCPPPPTAPPFGWMVESFKRAFDSERNRNNPRTPTFTENSMLKVAIIIGSTRPGRKAEAVARWVYDIAAKRSEASFEVVDIAAFNLPLLDEPVPPSMNQYS